MYMYILHICDGQCIAGGLYVVGTSRHESRRVDLQLRGRAGRQGDPGSTRFFLSLEDDLFKVFGGDKLQGKTTPIFTSVAIDCSEIDDFLFVFSLIFSC